MPDCHDHHSAVNKYKIEIGEEARPSICNCCGLGSFVTHGFIYKNEDAYAVYYATWSDSHLKKRITFAIAIGEWDDHSTASDRICFGVEARDLDDEIGFRVIEPEESPWSESDLLGMMLPRKAALDHGLLSEIFIILEFIIENHLDVKKYLD